MSPPFNGSSISRRYISLHEPMCIDKIRLSENLSQYYSTINTGRAHVEDERQKCHDLHMYMYGVHACTYMYV